MVQRSHWLFALPVSSPISPGSFSLKPASEDDDRAFILPSIRGSPGPTGFRDKSLDVTGEISYIAAELTEGFSSLALLPRGALARLAKPPEGLRHPATWPLGPSSRVVGRCAEP